VYFELGVALRMRVIPVLLLAMCICISPAFSFAQQPAAQNSDDQNDQLCTIGGTVLSANTGEPLKKAHVVLNQKGAQSDDPSKQPLTMTTDAAGPFLHRQNPAGSYDLVVSRADYLMPVEGTAHANKKARNKKLCERRIFELLDKESKFIVNVL
jgi:hypothetical protein